MAEAVAAATLLSGTMLSGTLFLAAPPAIAMPDEDNDGIEDWREHRAVCTDPELPDTDFDQLLDGRELELGTDPCDNDPDDDKIPDNQEVARGTNPFEADTDRDGVNDFDEIHRDHTDPKVANNAPDQGGPDQADGCPVGLPNLPNDCDGDGMFDQDEIEGNSGFVTNPKDPDSDDDNVNDGAEDDNGTNPLDPNDN
jgi:hypothetical protein